MPAFRNIRLCGKDCLCLYVCPTGATDTENSIIDVDKCIECMACVKACISGAISMIPNKYPTQQAKAEDVVAAQFLLASNKLKQQQLADAVTNSTESDIEKQFAQAIARSCRLMAEDVLREAGYLLPQSQQARKLLEAVQQEASEDFPHQAVELLLSNL